MRFLVDANMPRSTVPLLVRHGHQVEHVRDIGLQAAADDQIAAHARSRQAIILTRDLDFSDIRRYPPSDYFGIVVLRLPDDTVAIQIVDILERFLSHSNIPNRLSGRLVILETDHFRIRPPLD